MKKKKKEKKEERKINNNLSSCFVLESAYVTEPKASEGVVFPLQNSTLDHHHHHI